jgi:hypothetical protein
MADAITSTAAACDFAAACRGDASISGAQPVRLGASASNGTCRGRIAGSIHLMGASQPGWASRSEAIFNRKIKMRNEHGNCVLAFAVAAGLLLAVTSSAVAWGLSDEHGQMPSLARREKRRLVRQGATIF